jgi:hypothetical protein
MASDVLKVAPKAQILSVRVISDEDQEGDGIMERGANPLTQGIYYAVDHGADVISMSLGSNFGGFEGGLANAVGYAVSHGVPVLASAGNSGGESNDGDYPAGYAGVISVAATQQGGGRAEFSTVRTHNTVAAPGVGIMMAKNTGGYEKAQGTSPAAALASGVVALMRSENPKLSPAQTRAILTSTANHPPGGHNALVGYGQINAAAATKAAATPPADKTAPLEYKGKEHFASPVGTSKTTHPDMEQGLWLTGLGVAGAGLLMLVGGVLLALLGRRKAATSRPTGRAWPPSGSFPA